ncbi:hypothetical protein [Gordonia alkanivorans]|uniref:hypothetical protein n=1 Tax=Gordonia alkanivorans TaxID=84096 RepID=UPI0039C633A7
MTEISQTDVGPSTRPSELVQELHRITTELQAVDLTQCSDAELIDVAAGTERAIARLTFAGDRQLIEIADRDLPHKTGHRSITQFMTHLSPTGEPLEPERPALAVNHPRFCAASNVGWSSGPRPE